MADTYYVDLARLALGKAYQELIKVQGYLRDANLEREIGQTQATMNRIQNQLHQLAYQKKEDG